MFAHPLANIAVFLIGALALRVLCDIVVAYRQRIMNAVRGRGGWEE